LTQFSPPTLQMFGFSPPTLQMFGFSPPTLQMFGFSHFNKILLSLFDVSNVFQDSFLANIEAEMYQAG